MRCYSFNISRFYFVIIFILANAFRLDSLSSQTKEERYAAPIIAIDTLSALPLLAFDSPTGTVIGLAGYALGSPIVHSIKGNQTSSFFSLSLRTSIPLLALWLSRPDSKMVDKPPTSTTLQKIVGATGLVLPMLIDWIWLAKTTSNSNSQIQPISLSFHF